MPPPLFRPEGLQATPGSDRRLAVKSGAPLCACGPLCKSERGCECPWGRNKGGGRSEEHTSELQSLMRISYAVFCLKKKNKYNMILRHSVSNTHKTKRKQ